jgi:hypothetical protein
MSPDINSFFIGNMIIFGLLFLLHLWGDNWKFKINKELGVEGK